MFESTINYFQIGSIYRFKNKKTKLYLKQAMKVCMTKGEDNPDLLWVIEIKAMKGGQNLQWSQQNQKNLHITKKKQDIHQLWQIRMAQKYENKIFYWIKPIKNDELKLCCSSLSDKVSISDIDSSLDICLWQFIISSKQSSILSNLSIIKSLYSGLVIQIPQNSKKQDDTLIQYSYHGCGNQRWIFESYQHKKLGGNQQFLIKSFCSNFYLTACFGRTNFKVIQSCFNCSLDQRWILIKKQHNEIFLCPVSNNKYYLSVSNDKSGSQLTLSQDIGKSAWIIQGKIIQT